MTSHILHHKEPLIIISYPTKGFIFLSRNQIFSAYFILDHSLKQNTLNYFDSIIYEADETELIVQTQILFYSTHQSFLTKSRFLITLVKAKHKKTEPLSIKGSAVILRLFFFFSHERVEYFFDHVPFCISFDLF